MEFNQKRSCVLQNCLSYDYISLLSRYVFMHIAYIISMNKGKLNDYEQS